MRLKNILLATVVAGGMALTPRLSSGMFALTGENVPVERLIQNVSKYVSDHPQEAKGHYLLGRVYSLAYAKDGGQVRVSEAKEDARLPKFGPTDSVLEGRSSVEPVSPAAWQNLEHAIAEYRKATELDPKEGLYQLGYGWVLQQASIHAAENAGAGPATQPATLPATLGKPEDLSDKALAAYDQAYTLRRDADIHSNAQMRLPETFVAAEAAENAIAILKTRPQTDERDKKIAEYEDGIKKIYNRKFAITPIILPLHGSATLPQLLADPGAAAVTFDLAGDGIKRQWPWVKAGTALLCWDGGQTGRVTSGRQLFGSVTWWMFWENGYEPLAMLDDNQDGNLSGKELEGLALWVDRNGDGVSDVGEVMSVTSAGVVEIGVKPTRDKSGVLTNSSGIHWRDGTTSPTYDWTPQSPPAQRPK